MNRIKFQIILIAIAGISACYYDVEENLYQSTHCVTTGVSYQENIIPILQRNCYVCHSVAANTSNVTLEGYDKLMKHVVSGKFLGAVNHEPGFKPMPQGASKLIDCDLSKIEQWILDGAQDN